MITIYGTRSCGFCKLAVDKCNENKLRYEYKDAGLTKFYKELSEFNVDLTKMPHIFIGTDYVGDYKGLLDYVQKVKECI
jgi:Arsenate reductase and related proteins, glutaredoxin family